MNRNCLFSKAIALLLCAVLLIGYLPSIVLPAAAANGDEWESDWDVVETTTEEPTEPPAVGSEANPEVAAVGSYTATLEENDDGYYYTYTASVNGELTVSVYGSNYQYVITNKTTSEELASGNSSVYAADPVVKYTANDVISVWVNTYTDELGSNNPAGEVYVDFLFNQGWGTEDCPYVLTEQETYPTIANGTTVYYVAYNCAGMNMSTSADVPYDITVSGSAAVAAAGDADYGYSNVTAVTAAVFNFSITNNAAISEDEYADNNGYFTISFAYPVGTMDNPESITDTSENVAKIEAGSQGYFYNFYSYNNGYVYITVSADVAYMVDVNNYEYVYEGAAGEKTTYALKYQAFASEDAAEPTKIPIYVNTVNPSDRWNNPEGNITVDVEFVPGWGTADAPYELTEMENTVTIPAGQQVYYVAYVSGVDMTITGSNSYAVDYNGENFELEDESYVDSIPAAFGRPSPVLIAITNYGDADAEYTINFTYPVGTLENPAAAVLGDNTAVIETAGNGYYFDYEVKEAGNLIFTINGSNWLHNVTVGSYDEEGYFWPAAASGTDYYYDEDPVTNTLTLAVTEGQIVRIFVNTVEAYTLGEGVSAYHGYNSITGTVSFNLAYEVLEAPEAPAELKFATRNFVLQSSLAVNYKANADLFAEGVYENPYAVFTIGDRTETITEYAIEESTGRYVFTFAGITPGQMHRTISVTIYAYHQGFLYEGNTHTVSVRDYATSQLSKETSKTEWATLLVDMLNYGAAAQEYLESLGGDAGAPEDLANMNLTTEQAAWATQSIEDTTNIRSYTGLEADTASATWKSMRLVLESGVAMSFKVATDDVSKIYLKAYNPDGDKTWIIDTYATDNGDGTYWFNFSGMNADQFRQEVEFTFCNENGEAVSRTLHWSISSYSAGKLNEDSALNKMVYAMMKYGDACYAYKY